MQKVRDLYFPDADGETSRPYLDEGDFEPDVRAFAIERCRTFRRAVEVGAHVGRHTVRLAALFARTEAFEPQEQAFRALEANVRDLPVSAHRVALGDRHATAFISEHAGKNSAAAQLETERKGGCGPVPIRSLDEFGWDDVDLLKISIIRRADEVVAGALRTLDRSRPVIWLSTADGWTSDILQTAMTLGKLGYEPAGSVGRTLVLATPARRVAAPPSGPRVVDDDQLGPRLVWPLPTSPEDAGPRPASAGAEAMMLGAAVLEARVQPYREGRSVGRLASAELPGAVAPRASETVRGLGRRAALDAAGAEGWRLDDLLQSGVTARFARGAIRISAPVEALAYFRDLVVTLRTDDGERVILRQDLRQAASLDDIPARLPLALLDARPHRIGVHFITETGQGRAVDLETAVDPAELTPDMLTCYLNHGGGGNPAVDAFARSIGARMTFADEGVQEGAAFVWGVLRGSKGVIDAVQARHGIFYYMDHAYFARGHLRSYRITRNGFEAGRVRRCPPDRIQALGVTVKPWRRGGRYILVCPPTDYFIQAHGCASWLEDTLAALKSHTDREIIVRQKPKPGETVVPLEEAVAGAHALVTHSSNVAIEAVVAGTPVFVAPSSAAAPMGCTDLERIESPVYPDRDAWLAHLAYSQFTFGEIKYGAAWRMLLEWERREFV